MALNSLGPNPDISTPASAIRASRDLRYDFSARFTKSATTADLDYSLCPRCRYIDLDAVFDAADAGEDLNSTIIVDAGVLTEASVDSACRLCAFLTQVRLSSYNGSYGQRPWRLCAFNSLAVRGFPRIEARLTETPSLVLTLIADETSLVGNHNHASFIVPIRWSQPHLQQPSRSLYRARQLHASTINYGLIKEWLYDCENEHELCRLHRPMMKPIKVIDCLQRKIIASKFDTEYFALSYVWGKQLEGGEELSSTLENSKLPDSTPIVILDAISLVASLGFQYLWVDRFCIDQANVEEKHQQILQMDEIYEGALATIVVAPNKAADKGIPGVSLPRVGTPCVRISEKISLQSLSRMEESLQASEWNSRGWTYQEYCLSRRCLIVSDDQVHFVCRRGLTCEGVQEAALSDLPFEKSRCLDVGTLDSLCVARDPTFVRQLSAYTKRVLSYDSDRLNAFRGLLSRSQVSSYWGVPIYDIDSSPDLTNAGLEVRDPAAFHLGFSLGLCWSTHRLERPVRRLNFADSEMSKCEALPSWSWVSGRRVMRYPYFGAPRNLDELWVDKNTIEVYAEVFLEDPSSIGQESVPVVTKSPGYLSRVITERSPFIYIRSVVKTVLLQAWTRFERFIAWDCGAKPTQIDNPLEMILLIYQQDLGALGPSHFYMVVTMEGDTARRLGLACIPEKDESSLVILYSQKTIKVG